LKIDTPHEPTPDRAPAACARAQRADAKRNLALLLQAARTVFERDGLAAQMDAIAAEAGLGVGTLYRHFPTRKALIAVLIQERLERLVASAEAAASAGEAWAGVEGIVWQLATFEAEDRGMVDILADEDPRSAPARASMAALMDHLGTVVARAQAAGAMRGDISATDVVIAVCGIGKMMRPGADDDPARWRRLVGVILDGLRTSAGDRRPVDSAQV
jgi:AcrR family transcriptional regulator